MSDVYAFYNSSWDPNMMSGRRAQGWWSPNGGIRGLHECFCPPWSVADKNRVEI